jgi:sugar diacid utilization regulator
LELSKYYKQALAALNHGMDCGDGRHILYYDDFRVDYGLDSIKNDIDIWDLAHPVIPVIQEYDDEHGTSYADTLHMYLLTGKNLEASAKLMKRDRKALWTDIQALGDLFDIDWNNGSQLFSLLMSYKIAAYFRRGC